MDFFQSEINKLALERLELGEGSLESKVLSPESINKTKNGKRSTENEEGSLESKVGSL